MKISFKTVSILYLVVSAFFFVWSVVIFFLSTRIDIGSSAMVSSSLRTVILGGLYLVVGIGLWKFKKWAKISALILSGFVIIVSLYALLVIFHYAILIILILNLFMFIYLVFLSRGFRKIFK